MFDKYIRLIRKTAGNYARLYKLPYEDVEAQGFLIYCETLEKYDISSGVQFITFLYVRLKSLGDYCKAEIKRKGFEIYGAEYDLEPDEKTESLKVKDFLAVAKDMLTIEAYDVLNWLVSFEWNDDNKVYSCKPTIARVMKKFHYRGRKALDCGMKLKHFGILMVMLCMRNFY